MKKLKKQRVERRIYFFYCLACALRRQTFKKKVLRLGKCRKCRLNGVPESQMTMFDDMLKPGNADLFTGKGII